MRYPVRGVESTATESTENFGYRDELGRTVRRFTSFAVGFSFISVTTGIFTTYGTVLKSSGPIAIWTWPLVVVGQLAVALVFGALASRIPLAGYSYQWASRLTNPYLGWIIGWLVFAFLVVDVVAVDYSLASTVLPILLDFHSTATGLWVVTAGLIALQALLVMFSTVWSGRINSASVTTEIFGLTTIAALILIGAVATLTLRWQNWFSTGAVKHAGYFGFGTLGHAGPWSLGFLLGAFTIVGFEACGNLAEETQQPAQVVPWAMRKSVLWSGMIGFLFLLAVTAVIKDIPARTNSPTPIADIVKDALGPFPGYILLILVSISIFSCGLIIFISGSRVVWAMSRDQRFPGHRWLHTVDDRHRTPLAASAVLLVLLELVLAVFSRSTHALSNLFSTATLLPCLIYLATVVIYLARRRWLPAGDGFRLRWLEWPAIVVALGWLLFELSIFRDEIFVEPWLYILIMMGIGLVYLLAMVIGRRSLAMPGTPMSPQLAALPPAPDRWQQSRRRPPDF